MTKKIFRTIIVCFVFCLTACQAAPSPTSAPTIAAASATSKIIPQDFYNIVKIKYTMFKDGKAVSICIFNDTYKVTKVVSDQVVEITPQIEPQKVLGSCPGTPAQKKFELNVSTGEFIETDGPNAVAKGSYYGKNYQGNQDDVFSLSSAPIPVWKIVEPYNQKDAVSIQDIYTGTQEKWIDKTTGLLLYRKTSYKSVQDPTITYLVEMMSMRTNAPIGGLPDGKVFSYSKEN